MVETVDIIQLSLGKQDQSELLKVVNDTNA